MSCLRNRTRWSLHRGEGASELLWVAYPELTNFDGYRVGGDVFLADFAAVEDVVGGDRGGNSAGDLEGAEGTFDRNPFQLHKTL